MNRFSQLIDEQHILTDIDVTSKKALFELIANHICSLHPALADEHLVCALSQRERLGSTNIGHGIAIPHCRLTDTEQSILGVFTLATPIHYNDDEDVIDIVALLLVPESATDEHLKLLSEIAGTLNSAEVRDQVRASKTPADVIDALQYKPRLLKSGT